MFRSTVFPVWLPIASIRQLSTTRTDTNTSELRDPATATRVEWNPDKHQKRKPKPRLPRVALRGNRCFAGIAHNLAQSRFCAVGCLRLN